MTEQELKDELKLAYAEFDKNKLDIIKKYLDANNKYKIGDIIKDHIGSMKIQQFGYRLWESDPQMMYYGIELRKDGLPVKKQSNRAIYSCNILK